MSRFVFRNRLLIWLLTLGLVVAGLISTRSISRREDPDTEPRFAQVVAIWPGASGEQVERLLVDRLERSFLAQDDIKKVESVARPGMATLLLEAADDAGDFDTLWTEVRHRVTDLQPSLPAGTLPVIVNDRFTDPTAMIYGVVWPQATPRQREDVARRLRDRLRNVPQVAEANLLGEQSERVAVSLSSAALAQYGLSPGEVAAALQRRNVLPLSGGRLQVGEARLTVQSTAELRTLSDLENLAIRQDALGPVRLRDVAKVERTYADPSPFLLRVDGQDAVAVSLTMRKGRNIVELGEAVRKSVADFDLPPGARLVLVNDLPTSVVGRISEFYANLRDGVILILLVTYLFMGVRSASLVGAMLPLTILGTLATMLVFGRELQQMSITALIIALGLVVDNSVVVVDNIEHKMAQGLEAELAAQEGMQEILVPLLTSNLTTVAAFLPLAFLSGGKGDFIADLGYVTTMATLVSLVVNVAVLPLLAARFLKPVAPNALQHRVFAGVDRLRDGLGRLARAALARPFLTTAVAALAALLAVAMIPRLGVQFFPSAQRNQFRIEVWLPEGSDISATRKVVGKVETMLAVEPGVTSWVAYLGRGGPRFYYNINPEPPASNYAQFVVNSLSVEETARLVERLSERAEAEVPEARVLPQKLEQGPPIGAPISIRLSGQDVAVLRDSAEKVRRALATRAEVTSTYHNFGEITTQVQLDLDYDRLSQAGLTPQDVTQALAGSLSGFSVTTLREADREIPVELRLPASERSQVADLNSIHIQSPRGDSLPLSSLATLSLRPGEGRVARRNTVRTVTVSAHVANGVLASEVLAEALPQLRALDLPASIELSYGGEQEEVDRSFRELSVVFAVTIVAQLAIVVWEFRSVRIATTILLAVPFSLSGAILGLFVTGNAFGFTAFLGLITLGGVVTNHAIMFFEYANAEMSQGLRSVDALLAAGQKRLRPILLTVLLSVGGLLPLGGGGGNLWPPMAWSLIFGLLLSIVLAVVVVPSCYDALSRLSRPRHGWKLPGAALLLANLTSRSEQE